MLRLETWLHQPLTETELKTEIDLVKAIRHGLQATIIKTVRGRTNLTIKEIERIVASRRTLGRREHLTSDESDRLVRLIRLFALAEDVLGDAEKAQTWFRRPNRALENYTPLELLDTDSGARAVEQTLERLAYGVYS